MKILFVPIEATGHMNSAIGMAQTLSSAGHRITFAVTKTVDNTSQ